MSQVLDNIYGESEGEDTEQHSDLDEQVSEEEHNVEYHPEDTDTSDESDEEVTSAEAAPAERFKSDSCRAHLELRPRQHPPQPALPQHHPQQPQPQAHSGHLTLKERGVRSAQAVRTERQMYCASTATNISAKNTLKVSLFATHASKHTYTQFI